MKLVIDASMALAWIFERNNNKEALLAESTLSSIANVDVIVPALWHTEVENFKCSCLNNRSSKWKTCQKKYQILSI